MSSPTAPHLEDGINLGTALKALNHPLRRRILTDLRRSNPRDVAAFVSGADDHSVEIQLRHTHLPRLDDQGFIDWDRTSDTITRGPSFDAIEPLLRVLGDHQDELPGTWP